MDWKFPTKHSEFNQRKQQLYGQWLVNNFYSLTGSSCQHLGAPAKTWNSIYKIG